MNEKICDKFEEVLSLVNHAKSKLAGLYDQIDKQISVEAAQRYAGLSSSRRALTEEEILKVYRNMSEVIEIMKSPPPDKASASSGVEVKEDLDFGTKGFGITFTMPSIKYFVTKPFICPTCGWEAEHHTNLEGPPENPPFCLECFRKANIPIMVLKGGKE